MLHQESHVKLSQNNQDVWGRDTGSTTMNSYDTVCTAWDTVINRHFTCLLLNKHLVPAVFITEKYKSIKNNLHAL